MDRNNRTIQVHVVWNLRSSGGGDSGTTGLTVTPLEADVPEGGSLSFRVEVLPTKGNCYFAEEAEAFVSPSNQMTFRCRSTPKTIKPLHIPFSVYACVCAFMSICSEASSYWSV